jgi:hypothetical protein
MLLSMAVMMAREVWTDERLDDLANRMDRGFDEVKGEVRDLRTEMNVLRSEMNQRFDSMQRTMVIGFVTMSAAIIAALVGVTFAA